MLRIVRVGICILLLLSAARAQNPQPSPPTQSIPAPASAAPSDIPSPASTDGAGGADPAGRARPRSETNPIFGYVMTGGIAIAIALACGLIRTALEGSHWSLADALSEEITVSSTTGDGGQGGDPKSPSVVTKLCASTSRFIAMFGLVSILILYIGFGLVILNGYASTGRLPSSSDIVTVIKFIAAGGTLFAPYLINKVSSMFDWLSPKKAA